MDRLSTLSIRLEPVAITHYTFNIAVAIAKGREPVGEVANGFEQSVGVVAAMPESPVNDLSPDAIWYDVAL